jgi:hypothetical protein
LHSTINHAQQNLFFIGFEVVEEFGCSAWSAVCLGVQSEMNTSTETHLAPWFHGNLSAESISRVLSKSAVD